MNEFGVITAVLMLDSVSVFGSKYCATMIELSCTSRRMKSMKKDARLPIEPPRLPLYMCDEKSGLLLENGLRELNSASLSMKLNAPRNLSVPGRVRISMRPKPRRSYSAEKGF